MRPQVPIIDERFLGRPDLGDEARRLILEADSFAWHGDRRALRRDTRRYHTFVRHGWLVLRFSWEGVMHDQGYVLELLGASTQERTQRRRLGCRAA